MIANLDTGTIEENDTVLLPKKLKKPLVTSLSNICWRKFSFSFSILLHLISKALRPFCLISSPIFFSDKRQQVSDLIRESFQRLLATLFQDYTDYLYKSDMYYDFKV